MLVGALQQSRRVLPEGLLICSSRAVRPSPVGARSTVPASVLRVCASVWLRAASWVRRAATSTTVATAMPTAVKIPTARMFCGSEMVSLWIGGVK